LATELARHGTLQDRLDVPGNRGPDLDEAIRWIRHACSASREHTTTASPNRSTSK